MRSASQASQVEQAVDAAVVALMAKVGCDAVTVADIVREASVSRSSFYRHFDSVRDAFDHVENPFLEGLAEINRLSLQFVRGSDKLREASESMVRRAEFILQNRDLLLAAYGEKGDRVFLERSTKLLRNYFIQRLAREGIVADCADLYLSFVVAGHHAMINTWLAEHPEIPAYRIAEQTNKLFYSVFLNA